MQVRDRPSPVVEAPAETAAARTTRAAVIAVVLCGLAAAVEIRVGWSDLALTDEGYLWYGSQRVLAGEWPIKDFYSYDPGRYLWSAAWQFVMGDSIVTLRIASWIFAALGLTLGLLALQRVIRSTTGLVGAGALLVAWMVPRHKRIDCVLPLVAILAAVTLIERRDIRSHVRAGIVAGLIAFFGRNHGVYVVVGLTAVTWFVAPPQRWAFVKRVSALAGGTVVGYLPMLLLWIVYPSFLPAFLRLTGRIAENRGGIGAIVLPWQATSLREFMIALFYVAVPAVYAVVAAQLLRRRRNLEEPSDAVCLAATAIGIPYLHQAVIQPGPLHLAQATAPFVVLMITLAVRTWHRAQDRGRAGVVLGAVVLVVATAVTVLPAWEPYRVLRNPERFSRMEVDGVTLVVKDSKRRRLRLIEQFGAAAGDDRVLIAPRWPGVYAMLDKRAPTYHDYMIWSFGPGSDRQLINDLAAADVRWVLINVTGTGRRSFAKLYPQTMEHIERTFEEVEFDGQPSGVHVYRRDGS